MHAGECQRLRTAGSAAKFLAVTVKTIAPAGKWNENARRFSAQQQGPAGTRSQIPRHPSTTIIPAGKWNEKCTPLGAQQLRSAGIREPNSAITVETTMPAEKRHENARRLARTAAAVSGQHRNKFLAITVRDDHAGGNEEMHAGRRVTEGPPRDTQPNSRHHRRNDHAGRETS
ncbi:MAG: hypothetical protein ACLR23_21305 [Clostridia bacterium]